MENIVLAVQRDFPAEHVFVLEGDLGAGKTTFVKAFCHSLGIEEPVTSPTFSIVHEYAGPAQVYHFDLYRLEKEDDLHQIGFDEYLHNTAAYVFIEWPQLAGAFLPAHYLHVKIALEEVNKRALYCKRINNV